MSRKRKKNNNRKNTATARHKKRKRDRRLAVLGVCAITIVALFLFFVMPNSYRIIVGGEHVATISSSEPVNQEEFLNIVLAKIADNYGTTVLPNEELSFSRTNSRNIVSLDQALVRAAAAFTYQLEGGTFVVNGTPMLTVASFAEAVNIRDYLAAQLLPEGAHIVSVEVLNLEIRRNFVNDYQITARDTAIRRLTDTTIEVRPYTVAFGDSFWSIANDAGVSLDVLMTHNPNRTTNDRLREGDQLTVPTQIPLLTIRTEEEIEVITPVPSPVHHMYNIHERTGFRSVIQQGEDGEHKEIFVITRVNGVETDRRLISAEYISLPTETIIEIGRG